MKKPPIPKIMASYSEMFAPKRYSIIPILFILLTGLALFYIYKKKQDERDNTIQ